MAKKEPDSSGDKDARLQAAISRAEAEVERVKEWLVREQKEIDPRRSARTPDSVQGKSKEPSRPAVQRPATGGESLGVLNNILEEHRKSGVMAWRQLAIGIIAVLIATLGLIINGNRNTQTVVGQLEQSKLTITDPPEGASVGLGQKVRGLTPYPNLNHYIMVTLVRTGSAQVQPAVVTTDGTFSGDARFSDGGASAAGEDDEFTIRVLATKSRLEPGNLTSTPDDAIFSRQVTVRRTKPAEQIVINAPVEGADVSFDGTITGKTSLANLNHYIVVKSLKVGTSYVQDQPASVNRSDGTFSGKARFGGVEVGIGEQFLIRVLATKSTLSAAPLTNEPADAVFSNSVTVTRKK